MIVVTGATGQLGRLVIENLLKSHPANTLIAAVRNPAKAADLAARGVVVRQADYTQAASLDAAFAGAKKVLLISSSELGQRTAQHRAVIDAAVRSGVQLIGYTSLLHADTSPLGLAQEHRETEALLKASGLPHVVLRNGWYTENHIASLPAALAHGVVLGCAGDGRFSAATRADYAAAAAAAMTLQDQAGRIHELAGDGAYSLAEYAAEIARQTGKPVAYNPMTESDYKNALTGFGLPEPLAAMLADSDVGASRGGLYDDDRQLSALIGRPTTPLRDAVATALKASAN